MHAQGVALSMAARTGSVYWTMQNFYFSSGVKEFMEDECEHCEVREKLNQYICYSHQQKVNRPFTALPSFWRTFREFFDSRSRLTSKSRQEPGKV